MISSTAAVSKLYQQDSIWYAAGYQEVKTILSDERFLRRPPQNFGFIDQNTGLTLMDELISKWILFTDGLPHARLRAVFMEMINPRTVKEMKGMIGSLSQALLTPILQGSGVDFMQAFAFSLPVSVINILLGTSLDNQTIREWTYCLAKALDHGSPEDFQAITQTLSLMQAYFKQLVMDKEKAPTQDWISYLVQMKDKYALSQDDIIANIIFFLLAGHETTQLALGLGLYLLLKNPQQAALLQQQPDLISSAVEEIFRYEPPLRKVSRWTREDIVIQEQLIPANQLVVALIHEANKDSVRFSQPESFDIQRENNRHLTFGVGAHSCIGSLLSRLELQIALSLLIPHLDRFSLREQEIVWLPNSSMRYLYKLPIDIT